MEIIVREREQCLAELKNWRIMYVLKSRHWAIDGVGVFIVNNKRIMVFIQISLMNFSNHKKLLDIFESSKNFVRA